MHNLKGTTLKFFPVSDLKWVRDLEEYDGPLLSLFVHERTQDNYLYYWCDTDENHNRWMVSRISETNLLRLVNRKIPLDQIIPKGCEDDFVYFVDLDNKRAPSKTYIVMLEHIPQEYVPSQGAFLSASAIEGRGFYHVMIERSLSDMSWRNLLKEFSYAYSFLYNVIKLKSQRLKGHPWRGGFSAMHFWQELLRFIPVEDYPNIESMRFSSPGYIKYKLDSEIAQTLGNMVTLYLSEDSDGEIDTKYKEFQAFVRTNKLLDIETEGDPIWAKYNVDLEKHAREMLKAMKVPQYETFIDASRRPFEAARMAASFVKRIAELAEMENDRLVSFPSLREDNDIG